MKNGKSGHNIISFQVHLYIFVFRCLDKRLENGLKADVKLFTLDTFGEETGRWNGVWRKVSF